MNTNTVTKPIDIILPTHNHLELTITALNHLYDYTNHPFHVIIVDDSSDLTPAYLKKLAKEKKNITCIFPKEKLVHGNQIINIGLKHATSPVVGYLGNSTRVEPNWIDVAIRLFEDPKVGIVGFKLLFPNGTIEHAGMYWLEGMQHHMNFGVQEAGHRYTFINEVGLVGWALVLFRPEIFPDGLDEKTFIGFRGFDDVANCLEAIHRGWKVLYCGLGCAYHQARATRGQGDQGKFAEECEYNRKKLIEIWGNYLSSTAKQSINVA